MASQVFYDLQLIRFYENKTGTILMVGKSEVVSVKKYFPNYESDDLIIGFRLPEDEFNLQEHPITIILEKFKDKIYLEKKGFCYVGKTLTFPKGFILYFYSCSQESQKSIMEEMSNMYHILLHEQQPYLRFRNKFFVQIDMEIRTEDRHLSNIGKIRFGWNQVDGHFCPIVDAAMLTLESITDNLVFMKDYPISMKDYREFDVVGISYSEYLLFSRCRKLYNIPFEIFKILCDTWLMVLVYDAKDRLVTKES